MDKESVEVTGLHHYVDGGESVVALEINGHWHEISRQSNDSPYSHCKKTVIRP